MYVFGDTLEIDLGRGAVHRRATPEADLQLVLAGRGLTALRLLRDDACHRDALAPDNPLHITLGLLTGTAAPSASRVHIGARSPLTGILGSSSIGGVAGHALRSLGLGSIVLRGRSAQPAYLLVTEGGAELRNAEDLWGVDATETARRLAARHSADDGHSAKPALLVIGPAGENQAHLACVLTEGGHAAGRTGMGAVMGAKRLKAVVILPATASKREHGAAAPARAEMATSAERAHAAVKRYTTLIKTSPGFEAARQYGSTDSVVWSDRLGMLPTRNFTSPQFAGAAATDGTNIEQYVVRTHGCPGCAIRCKAEVRVQSGRRAGFSGERPDYEPLVAWGAKVGIDDPEAVLDLHDRCDRLGLDSISAGAAVAFACDLFERGIIDRRDTGGLLLTWGDAAAAGALLDEMAAHSGFGGLLADGVRHAAKVLGRGAERYAYEVKGLEMPSYDPRGAFGAGLSFAVAPRGGDFTSVYARQEFNLTPQDAARLYGDERAADPVSPIGKAAVVRTAIIASSAIDALGMCKIPTFMLLNDYWLKATAELVDGVTGLGLTADDLLAAGERIAVLERLFDLRCGINASDDKLPAAFAQPLAAGPRAGSAIDVTGMRDEFYQQMGWTNEGAPSEATLARLGLSEEVLRQPGSAPAFGGGARTEAIA
jgi:aldehyde:ferredoxin oxidoreductase